MDHFKSIIGKSPALESLLRSARMVASTDVTVFIKGETGTGKEVLASAIQKESARANKPFIKLNCAALPESLVESELFGHKKGAFTGANSNKQGIFQAADGGTLFLDEINSLPLLIQAKLLRVLELGECLAVGETKPYHVDVRVIAASNQDLVKQIEAGQFRRDLYFRLNVVPLELPPLSKRTEDIEPLVEYFVSFFAQAHSLNVTKFSKQALKVLCRYSWPGNIRELRNLCERLSILLPGKTIEPENLPQEFASLLGDLHKSPLGGLATETDSAFTLPDFGIELDTLEANLINQALAKTNGNRSKSAKLLGISRDTLLYRMQKHGLAF